MLQFRQMRNNPEGGIPSGLLRHFGGCFGIGLRQPAASMVGVAGEFFRLISPIVSIVSLAV
jgi:hypothetical protein